MTDTRAVATGTEQPAADKSRRGLRFVLLSGMGWVLDTVVFLAVVASGQAGVMMANVMGGACGAAFAFLTSNRWVFAGREEGVAARLVVYLAYTVALIFAASALVDLTARFVAAALAWWSMALPHTMVAFIAKCVITPLTLAANFVVARFLIERGNRRLTSTEHG